LIHSNIESSQGYQVVDYTSGEKLGEIGYMDTHLESFILSGKSWQVIEVRGSEVIVKPSKGTTETLNFVRIGRHGAFYNLLPKTLKDKTIT
jgi:Lhr-like helicase